MTLKPKIVELLEKLTRRKHGNIPWRVPKSDGYRWGAKTEAVMVIDYLLDIRKLYMVQSRRRAACLEDVKQVVRERMDSFFAITNVDTGRQFVGVVVVFDKGAPINKCIGRCGRGREGVAPIVTPTVAGVTDPVECWRVHCENNWNDFGADDVNWHAHCSNVDFKMFIVDYISMYLRDEYCVPISTTPSATNTPRFLVNYGPLPGRHDFYKTAVASPFDPSVTLQRLVLLEPDVPPAPLAERFQADPTSKDYVEYHQEQSIRENWLAHFDEADAAVGFWAFGLWLYDVFVNSADGDVFLALLLSSYMRLHLDEHAGYRPDVQIARKPVHASFINEVFWIRNDTLGKRVINAAGQEVWEEHGYTVDINRCCLAIWRYWYKMLTKRSPLDFSASRRTPSLSKEKEREIVREVLEGAIESFVVMCCLCGNDYVQPLPFGPQIIFSAYFERTRCILVHAKRGRRGDGTSEDTQSELPPTRNECKSIRVDADALNRFVFDIYYHKYASTTKRENLKQMLVALFPHDTEKQFPNDEQLKILYGNLKWCIRNWINSAFGGHTIFLPDPLKNVAFDDRRAKYGWILDASDTGTHDGGGDADNCLSVGRFRFPVTVATTSNTYARKGQVKVRRPY